MQVASFQIDSYCWCDCREGWMTCEWTINHVLVQSWYSILSFLKGIMHWLFLLLPHGLCVHIHQLHSMSGPNHNSEAPGTGIFSSCDYTNRTGPRRNIKMVSPGMGIPMLKIRWSRDRLIFNMGILILVRGHLYIETAPWSLSTRVV